MKTPFKLAIILVAIGGNLAAGPAFAHGPGQTKITFWDSEDYNYVVGWNLYYCDGHHAHVGSYSLYSTEENFNCP